MIHRHSYIIGIDEAGRGPLAGPLIVGGVLVADARALRVLKGIRDSKKLSQKQRETWYGTLVSDGRFICGTTRISPRVIDRLNIARAADRGAYRVYRKLLALHQQQKLSGSEFQYGVQNPKHEIRNSKQIPNSKRQKIQNGKISNFEFGSLKFVSDFDIRISNLRLYHALLDGSLHLPAGISHEVFIKGDERIPLIAAASIIAKVTRDRLMVRLHKKSPQWGFDVHKGYGTKLHRERIKEHGLSPAHRISFRIKT